MKKKFIDKAIEIFAPIYFIIVIILIFITLLGV